ncbi:hypothetical protein D3OALGA1CA_4409 [Olavius algarvensis associated proteobacterium Delta 3]|nr:hypothetical protein D3OALGB2SA_3298 [Olavius algarvensis associated proteobacterium Delta 3]CAB5150794.1 hypothetical protein D3OALGA1CA_4409 [Olavius algarvensis associated proteobacterium Delta 3]
MYRHERIGIIGIGIGFGIGIDFEVGHSVSIPIAIPIPNMSIPGLPRKGIRLTETHYVQTEHIYGNDYNCGCHHSF